MGGDIIALEAEDQAGEPLIELVMKDGKRVRPSPDLEIVRAQAATALAQLPEPLRRLEEGAAYPVRISEAARELADQVDRRIAQQQETDRWPPV
jgi:nicotinate phosphoribosyltransferase